MAVMDEFREERERIKKYGTWKEKLEYFWDYYKWHAIIAVIAVVVLCSSVYRILTEKDIVLSGMLLNCYSAVDEEVQNTLIYDFLTGQQIDVKKNDVALNASLHYSANNDNEDYNNAELSYATSQMMLVQVASGDLDFITGDLETLTSVAYSSFFVDLTTVLDEEQLAFYEPYLFYIDQAVLDALNEAENTDAVETIKIPDGDKPETMENPIPIMIDISRGDYVKKYYPYMTDDNPIVFGFTVNSKHVDTTAAFLDYLIK